MRLLRAGRQYLDLALDHPRAEHRELAVARICALAGQRVELPQVVHAGQRGPVKASLAELETQMRAAVLEGPDLACDVEQDDLLPAQLDPGQFSLPEVFCLASPPAMSRAGVLSREPGLVEQPVPGGVGGVLTQPVPGEPRMAIA